MNRIMVLLFVILQITVYAQTSEKYNSEYANFYRGEELFAKEQYAAARLEFRNFINTFHRNNDPLYIKALYYEGISALELYNNDAVTLLTDFNKNYPESIYKNEIFWRLGNYYYQKKDFDKALVWYKQVKVGELPVENKEEFYFKLGYSYYKEDKLTEARNAFYEAKDGSSVYAAPALYYYSHISYQEQAYQTALEGFLKLQTDERFGKVVPYYIAQIYYLQGKYKEVTEYAPNVLDTTNVVNQNDMNHIVGDSYYKIGKYDEAVTYLEAYNKTSKTTRDDDYELGYAYYKSKMYEKAISMFDKVSTKKDSIGQYAYYHIGECYLKLNNQTAARSAFKAAYSIELNPNIREDALYNYAVLSYSSKSNPYDEAVVALEEFLDKFPQSKRKNDIYQYLVNVYLSTNNYEKALTSLEKIPNKDAKLKTAYQLVAFNQGVELFQKAEYQKAIKSFDLVDKYPVDAAISAKAIFWTADANYRLNNIDKSISGYKDFIAQPGIDQEMKADAYYNQGYAYLKKGENYISQSIEAFRQYTQLTNKKNKNKLADAYMRIADNFYMTKQDENAVKNYQEVIKLKSGYEDQALYYMARSYGFLNKDNEEISRLLDIINNYTDSKFTISAIYEVASVYKEMQQYDKSLRYYNQLVTDYPNSTLMVSARNEIADIYFKKHEFAKSETEYKSILNQYGNDRNVCATAARGLIDIYNATKQPDKATAVTEEYSCADVTIEEKEGMYFNPAFEAYKDSSYKTAIPQFERYLEKFPKGTYSKEVNYYLAVSLDATKQQEKAVEYYKKVLESHDNSMTEYAASRVAKYYYNNEKYEEAIPYYERLEKVGTQPTVIFNAQLGLMRSNFIIENWANSANYALKVLSNTQINNTLKIEAQYAYGMSNFYIENFKEAKPSLEWLVKNTTTEKGAEAKYSLAEMYYKQLEYDKADAEVRALLKMKPVYNYWVAKGLILQTRVLIVKNDLFQAEQTLKSVIDHYPDPNDGILTEANSLWDELMQLKNQPKKVETKEETVIDVNGGN